MSRDFVSIGNFEEKLYVINHHIARRLVDGRYSNINEGIRVIRLLGFIGYSYASEIVERRIRTDIPYFVKRIKNESAVT